jgi:hypothetical protein
VRTVDIIYRYEAGDAPKRRLAPDSHAALLRLNDGNRDFAALLDHIKDTSGVIEQIIPVDPRDLGLVGAVRSINSGVDQLVGIWSGKTFVVSRYQADQAALRRALIASHPFEADRYPTHCSRHFSADLWAAELQDHAIGILQLNACSSAAIAPPAPIAL